MFASHPDFFDLTVIAWQAAGDGTKGAIIQSIATLFAASIGFGAVVSQIRSQGAQSRHASQETERRRVKSALFEDGTKIVHAYVDRTIEFHSCALTLFSEMKLNSELLRMGQPAQPVSTRFLVITQKHQEFANAALSLVFLIEQRQFIDLRLLVFRDALLALLHACGELVHRRFFSELLPLLPFDDHQGVQLYSAPLTIEAASSGSQLANEAIELLQDALSIGTDFQTAMQNLLMGELFGTIVPNRNPADPNHKVWTIENSTALREWLSRETAWGKMNAKAIADAEALVERARAP